MVAYSDPTIEVLSSPPRYEMITSRLRSAGLRPIRAALNTASAQTTPLLLDLLGADEAVKELMSSPSFNAIAAQRVIVVLGTGQQAPHDPNLMQLSSIDQISSLPARLAIRQREARRIQEATLRTQTANTLGEATQLKNAPKSLRALFLGEYSRTFIDLKAALSERGIETVAALSHVTAHDYLDSGNFHAVILHPGHSEDEAAKYLVRHNINAGASNPHHCLLEAPGMGDFLAHAYTSRVDSLIPDSHPASDIAQTLLTNILQSQQTPGATSQGTCGRAMRQNGLYSRAFFEAHLEAQIEQSEAIGDPVSVLCIAAQDRDQRIAERAPQIIRHLRDTDLAAELNASSLFVSLRATPYRGAIALARRIEDSLDIPVVWRVAERRRFHTLKTLLSAVSINDADARRRRA